MYSSIRLILTIFIRLESKAHSDWKQKLCEYLAFYWWREKCHFGVTSIYLIYIQQMTPVIRYIYREKL